MNKLRVLESSDYQKKNLVNLNCIMQLSSVSGRSVVSTSYTSPHAGHVNSAKQSGNSGRNCVTEYIHSISVSLIAQSAAPSGALAFTIPYTGACLFAIQPGPNITNRSFHGRWTDRYSLPQTASSLSSSGIPPHIRRFRDSSSHRFNPPISVTGNVIIVNLPSNAKAQDPSHS